MATDFTLPELGENITAGDVVRILVSPGDTIAKDQPVIELETDKATIEVPSSVGGTVKDVRIKQGDRIKVGQVVLTVENGGSAAAKPGKSRGEAAEKPKAQPVGAPEEGGLSQAAPGTAGRATPTETGSGGAKGMAEERLDDGPQEAATESGARPRRGEVVDIGRGARASAPAASEEPPDEEGPAPAAAPSVRRLARELGVDIRRVNGSGPGGRISPEDVQSFARSALAGAGGGVAASAPLPDLSKWGRSSAGR